MPTLERMFAATPKCPARVEAAAHAFKFPLSRARRAEVKVCGTPLVWSQEHAVWVCTRPSCGLLWTAEQVAAGMLEGAAWAGR